MIGDDDCGWTNLGQTIRCARKRHRCYECSRTIEPGERYEDARGVGDGRVTVMRSCAHCIAARSWLDAVCRGYLWGGVWDDLQQHWDEEWSLRTLDLGRVMVWHRRRWIDPATGDLVDPRLIKEITRRAAQVASAVVAEAERKTREYWAAERAARTARYEQTFGAA